LPQSGSAEIPVSNRVAWVSVEVVGVQVVSAPRDVSVQVREIGVEPSRSGAPQGICAGASVHPRRIGCKDRPCGGMCPRGGADAVETRIPPAMRAARASGRVGRGLEGAGEGPGRWRRDHAVSVHVPQRAGELRAASDHAGSWAYALEVPCLLIHKPITRDGNLIGESVSTSPVPWAASCSQIATTKGAWPIHPVSHSSSMRINWPKGVVVMSISAPVSSAAHSPIAASPDTPVSSATQSPEATSAKSPGIIEARTKPTESPATQGVAPATETQAAQSPPAVTHAEEGISVAVSHAA